MKVKKQNFTKVTPLRKIKKTINLDIACGFNKQPNFIGMDKRAVEGVDIVHDIEVIPWPVKTESVSIALLSHILEHVDPRKFLDIIAELWRILIPDGQAMIAVPYANSFGGHQDPTHMRPGFNEGTWQYFDPAFPLWQIYRSKPFRLEYCAANPLTNMEVRMRAIKRGSKGYTEDDFKKYDI